MATYFLHSRVYNVCYIQVSGLMMKLLVSAALTGNADPHYSSPACLGEFRAHCLLSHYFLWEHPLHKRVRKKLWYTVANFPGMFGRLGLFFSDPSSYRIPRYSSHPFPSPVMSQPYLSQSYPYTYKPCSSTAPMLLVPASTVLSLFISQFEEQVQNLCTQREKKGEKNRAMKTLCHCPVCSGFQMDCRSDKVRNLILKNKDFVVFLTKV